MHEFPFVHKIHKFDHGDDLVIMAMNSCWSFILAYIILSSGNISSSKPNYWFVDPLFRPDWFKEKGSRNQTQNQNYYVRKDALACHHHQTTVYAAHLGNIASLPLPARCRNRFKPHFLLGTHLTFRISCLGGNGVEELFSHLTEKSWWLVLDR